ncbi:hypothetical protein NDU88_000812 [Pleurodeles waltl]|uniref:Uncharacterized protein n=1 Tax=Pleurodeles waltl TaxID=8319 RepID=A0AAV7L7X2_PLEWA|nr:hypothetical protein NDU88_000812 [Pleurodeles waltl]
MHNEEPSLRTSMAAIQDLRGSITPLEPKLDAVTFDVNLLMADFGKISKKVEVAETHIERLLSTTKRLEWQGDEVVCSGSQDVESTHGLKRGSSGA